MDIFQDFSFFRVFEQTDFNFKFSGENQKNILVIFYTENLNEDISYIEKILSVAKINLQTDCSFTICNEDNTFLPPLSMWFEKTNCNRMIIFGLGAEKFGCNFQNYLNHCIEFSNYKIVFSDSLAHIRTANAETKKQIREALLSLISF